MRRRLLKVVTMGQNYKQQFDTLTSASTKYNARKHPTVVKLYKIFTFEWF